MLTKFAVALVVAFSFLAVTPVIRNEPGQIPPEAAGLVQRVVVLPAPQAPTIRNDPISELIAQLLALLGG